VLGVSLAPGTALAAPSARPATDTNCDKTSYAQLCFEIVGTGDVVSVMEDGVQWYGSYADTHLEIVYAPTGSPYYNSPPGTDVSSLVHNFNNTAQNVGNWCGIAWQKVGKSYYNRAEACVYNDE
jgi:hypothetical protein